MAHLKVHLFIDYLLVQFLIFHHVIAMSNPFSMQKIKSLTAHWSLQFDQNLFFNVHTATTTNLKFKIFQDLMYSTMKKS